MRTPGRAQLDLDDLGGVLAEGQAVLLLDVADDGLVQLVAGDAHARPSPT